MFWLKRTGGTEGRVRVTTGLRALPWLLALLPQLGLAAVGAYLLTSLGNTLRRNGHWSATKAGLERHAIGSEAFATSRQTLSTECLDLGRWFGFQEVLAKEPVELGEVSFDFLLTEGSYLVFVFDKSAAGFSGLRISAAEGFGDLFFRADGRGAFTMKLPLELPARTGVWQRLVASFGEGRCELTLDGEPILERSIPFDRRQVFGFRNGLRTVLIDDVRVRDADGHEVLRDSFFPVSDFVRLFGLIALGVSLANAAGIRWAHPRGRSLWTWGQRLLLATSILFAGSLAVVLLYRAEFSKGYPLADPPVEQQWLQELSARVREGIRSEHALEPAPGVVRVLVIGSSQTWGAGATRRGESLVDFLQRDLNSLEGPRYECVNAGIPGSTAPRLLEIYRADWLELRPAITVVNLSNNDSQYDTGAEAFGRALAELARLDRERGIATVFVLEANSSQYRPEGPPLHATMRRVAEEQDVPLVDAHAYLRERRDEGFLWWDFVHPTSLGHERIAEVIAPAVSEASAHLAERAPEASGGR